MRTEVISAKAHDDFWQSIKQIRFEVFVEEQKVDEREEYDEYEEMSQHFVALADGFPVGTARWRRTAKGYKLERFAVLKSHRKSGIGSAVLQAVLAEVTELAKKENLPIYLHAQVQALPFYALHGFQAYGDEFIEAEIVHRAMKFKF